MLGQYDAATGVLNLSADQPDAAQVRKAMAHVMMPSLLYREQRYRLSP